LLYSRKYLLTTTHGFKTRHNAVLTGHNAGKKGEEKKEKEGKKKKKRVIERKDVKIALQIQSKLTSTIEILYLLILSFYLKHGKQHSTE
jgi:hypothetical protein